MKENYNWKFVVTVFALLGLMISPAQAQQAQIITDTVYLFQSGPAGSGTVTTSAFTDTSEARGYDSEDGYLSFDLSSLPANAYVQDAELHIYVNNTDWPYWSVVPLDIDPDTATASAIKSTISFYEFNTTGTYFYRNESSLFSSGWYSYDLSDPAGSSTSTFITYGDPIADLNAQISQGWFGMGIVSRDNSSAYYIEVDGWAESNPPYLEIQYELLNCPFPSGLAVDTFTDNSVTLSWTPGDVSTTGWVIEYGPLGFALGTGTTITVNSNPYTVTGLMANTDYSFYVADSCASNPGLLSPAFGPFNVITACLPSETAPWTEQFTTANSENCWTHNYVPSGSNLWQYYNPSNGGFPSPAHGVGNWPEHSGNNGGYMYWDGSYNTNAVKAAYQSPLVDVSGLLEPSLSFYYMSDNINYPNQNNTLYINFYDGATWHDSIWSFAGNVSDWTLAVVDLSSYTITGAVQFELVVDDLSYILGGPNTSEFYNDILVDDVSLQEAPPCPIATSAMMDTITTYTATVSWTVGSTTSTSWEVVIGPPGSDPDTLTAITVTTNPYTITGLNPVTSYSVWVREECPGTPGVFTWWTGPVNFTTECAPYIAPYLNTFTNPAIDLYCWTSIDTGTSTINPKAWAWYNPITGGFPAPNYNVAAWPDHTGNNGGYIFWDGSRSSPTTYGNYIYESGEVDVTSLSTPEVRFYYMSKWDSLQYPSGVHNTLYVDIWDGAAWNDSVWSFKGNVNDWTEAIISLSPYTITGPIMARLHIAAGNPSAVGSPYNYYNDILVDDFRVTDPPPCANPSSFAANAVTNNMVDLSWVVGTASATQWDIAYGAPGFNPDTSTSYLTVGTNTNYLLTGLSDNTSYQVYIREHCVTPAGSYSWWIGPMAVTTKCDPFATPYLETFTYSSTFTAPDIPQCWETYADSLPAPTYLWRTYDPDNPFAWPYPGNDAFGLEDHTGDGGGYAWLDHGFTQSKRVVFESPLFDVSTLSNPNIQFFIWRNNSSNPNNNMSINVDVWDGTQWNDTALGNYVGNDTAWIEVNILLNEYMTPGPTAAPISFKIWVDQTAAAPVTFGGDVLVDDISVDEAPPCPNPSFMTTTGVTDTTISFRWKKGNKESIAHYMVYDTTLIDPDTVSNPLLTFDYNNYNQNKQFDTITNLLSNQVYYIWVRELCPDFTFSEWLGPMVVTTFCAPIAAPFVEGFESTTGIYWSGSTIPECWRQEITDDYNYESHSGFLSYGPGSANEGSRYLFAYPQGFVQNSLDSAVIYMPDLDISALTKPTLRFDYFRYSTYTPPNPDGTFEVQVYNENTGQWNVIWSRTGEQGAIWNTFAVDLQPYMSYSRLKLRFVAYSGSFSSYYYRPSIDHVRVIEGPDCWQPSNFSVYNVTGSTATLGWVPNDPSATQWIIAYGPQGINPDTSANVMYDTVSAPAGTPAVAHTLTGLSSFANYVAYVSEVCPGGSGSKSWWEGVVSFLTPIVPPYLETFDNLASIFSLPDYWEEADGLIANPTDFTSTFSSWGMGDFGNNAALTRSIVVTWYSWASYSEWVMTPPIDLGFSGNWNLYFDMALTNGFIANDTTYFDGDDTVSVVISTDGGLTWNKFDQILLLDTFNFVSPVGQLFNVPLNAYTGTVKFGFYLQSGLGGATKRLFVDNVRIDEPPACLQPTGLNIVASGGDWMELDWIAGASGNSEWEVQFTDKFGFTSTYTVFNTNPIITGLQDNMCYEVQVREVCASSPGDYSWWTNPMNGCTAILPPWIETFDNTPSTFTFPDGWTETDGLIGNPSSLAGTFSSWVMDDFANDLSQSRCARMNIYSTFPKEWLMTPPIELGAVGAWTLEFDWSATDYFNTSDILGWGYDDSVHVVVSDDGGQTWWRSNAVVTIDSAALAANSPSSASKHVSVPLDMYTGTIMIGFYAESTVSNEDNDFFIDNVEIRGPEVACDDFDGYMMGELDSQSSLWNSWAGFSGAEDTEVSDDYAFSGTQSMKVHESGINTISDIVADFGEGDTTGMYEVNFAFLQPSGYGGYFNLMHDYDDGSNFERAIEVWLEGNNGDGEVKWASQGNNSGTIGNFSFTPGNWTQLNIIVDLDNDLAELIVNGLSTMTWQWSNGNGSGVFKQLSACNMYSDAPSGLTALTYYDDVCVGDFVPNCVIATTPSGNDINVDCNTPATFNASAGTTGNFVIWTDSTGNYIGTGDSYTTLGPLTEDLAVNVLEATLLGGQMHIGMKEDDTPNGDHNLFTAGMHFSVFTAVRWDSVTVDADGALDMQVVVYSDDPVSGGVVLFRSNEQSIAGAGVYRIPVNLALQPGAYFVNVERTNGSGNLFRTSDGAAYPYVIPNVMTIDSVSSNVQNKLRWYYIFDWVINDEVCIGTDFNTLEATVVSTADAQASTSYTPPTPTEMVWTFTGTTSVGTNHTWTIDGTQYNGDQVQHTFTVNGPFNYTLEVTDECGNVDIFNGQDIVTGIGIEDLAHFGVSIYPNPNEGVFQLSFSSALEQEINIRILNALGQVVYEESLEAFSGDYSNTIDIANEAAGVYTLQIVTEEGTHTDRISVQ